MRNRKILIIVMLCMLFAGHVAAQDTVHHVSVQESTRRFTQGIGWIQSPLPDNWFVQVQGGGDMYFGFEDRLGKFKDQVSPCVSAYIGRWVFPMLGFRIGAAYNEYTGFISNESYDKYHPWVGNGYQQYNSDGSSLHGYYWDYPTNKSLKMQTWRAISVSPDVVIHVNFAQYYDPEKTYTTLAYIGAGFHIVPPKYDTPVNLDGVAEVAWAIDPNMEADFHVGLIEKIRLGERFDFYGDVRFSMMGGNFDREDVSSIETGLRSEDYAIQAQVGIAYNFNFRSKEKRLAWYQQHINPDVAEPKNVPAQIYTSHEVRLNILTYIDTIFAYDTISEFSDLYDSLIYAKARSHAGQQLDSLRAAFDRDCHEYTLDDILGKSLLPYEMVFFERDKWAIISKEELKIAKMASVMNAFPNYHFLLIGSADSKTGTSKRNQLLSTNRSDAVYNKLVYEYDVNPDQLKRVYLGGILDFAPYELNRATVIIMDHPKVLEEFDKLRAERKAGGGTVETDD